MKCPEGSYAQLETVGKKLAEFRDVRYTRDWRATTGLTKPVLNGTYKLLEVRAVDFIGGGQQMIDDYAYQGKKEVECKAFLFRFVPIDDHDKVQTVRFTFDDEDGFLMVSERNLREDVDPEIMEAFDRLIIKLRQEMNCLEADKRPQYPCVVLAESILSQSTELKKSYLLNNTISMHSAIKDAANRLRDPQYAEDREAMWTLVISPGSFLDKQDAVVCAMYGKYIDCLRAAVCFKQVYDLMFALHHTKLSDHIYLIPTLTAYPKGFVPN